MKRHAHYHPITLKKSQSIKRVYHKAIEFG